MKKKPIIIGIIIVVFIVAISIRGGVKQMTANIFSTEEVLEEYNNEMFGFSFLKPKDYMVSQIDQENGQSVLLQDAKGRGFQIVISRLDIIGVIVTKNLIQSDIPDMTVVNDEVISVDGDSAFRFESTSELFEGHSLEVWFVHKDVLYQISGYFDSKESVDKVLQSWKWK